MLEVAPQVSVRWGVTASAAEIDRENPEATGGSLDLSEDPYGAAKGVTPGALERFGDGLFRQTGPDPEVMGRMAGRMFSCSGSRFALAFVGTVLFTAFEVARVASGSIRYDYGATTQFRGVAEDREPAEPLLECCPVDGFSDLWVFTGGRQNHEIRIRPVTRVSPMVGDVDDREVMSLAKSICHSGSKGTGREHEDAWWVVEGSRHEGASVVRAGGQAKG